MKTTRGRVLRDTTAGDGLVSVDGTQFPFRLEGMWKSDHAPRIDMPVDVDFDEAGTIVAIRTVDPAAAAREHAQKIAAHAGVAAKQAGAAAKQAAAEFQARGLPVLKDYAGKVGVGTLASMAIVAIGWFFLAAVSVDFLGDKMSATFYDLMRVLNNPQNGAATIAGQARSGAGFYGFMTFLALLLPLLPHVFRTRAAWLAYCAPAAWMLLTPLVGYLKINSGISEAERQFGSLGGGMGGMAREFMREAFNALSIGLGIYVAVAAAAYLAWVGLRRYRAPSPAPVAA